MDQCRANKANGAPCKGTATGSHGYCWAHAPENAAQRHRSASKAAKAKPNKEVRELRAQLTELYNGLLLRTVDPKIAAVGTQILNARARLVETELRVREQEELLPRLE